MVALLKNLITLSTKLSLIVENTKELINNEYYSTEPRLNRKVHRATIAEAVATNQRFPVFTELKFSTPVDGPIKDSSLENAKNMINTYSNSLTSGLSIITEPKYFFGSLDYLDYATSYVPGNIPILMKDFVIHPIQVECAKKFGASTILLISRILTDETQQELIDLAHSIDLEVLLEVNTTLEMTEALESDVTLIGINNRNLSTMEVSLDTTEEILRSVNKKGKKILSLSGINTKEDASKVKRAGSDGILVGSSIMRSESPLQLIEELSKV